MRATQARSARTHAESVQAAARELGEAQERVASLGQASRAVQQPSTFLADRQPTVS
eukprot:COSAG01_NODE_1868_length_9028_cov_3.001232_12_plen_56_part_00